MTQDESPKPERDARTRSDDEPTGTPRWVIASGVVVLVLIVAFAVFHFAGGGFVGHGPLPGGP